jgi:hypothetical protein
MSSAAAAAKQDDTEMAAEITEAMTGLANVEASLSDSSCTEIEGRSLLFYRREELAMRFAQLGAEDIMERMYRSK